MECCNFVECSGDKGLHDRIFERDIYIYIYIMCLPLGENFSSDHVADCETFSSKAVFSTCFNVTSTMLICSWNCM